MNKAPPVQAVKAGLCPINNGGFFFSFFWPFVKNGAEILLGSFTSKKETKKGRN